MSSPLRLMAMRIPVAIFAGSFAVLSLSQCEAVPNIKFVGSDGATDGADDGHAGGQGDGAVDGASEEGGALDSSAGDGGVCPTAPPEGANACCDTVPCVGGCNTGDCQKCITQCGAAGLVCCTARKPITCVPAGTACP